MAIARQRIHLPGGSWSRALAGSVRGSLWNGDAAAGLERAFAEVIGTPDAVAVPSGRAGLCFTYEALGLEKGSEVICSAFAYPVIPHLSMGLGYDVKFADCEMETLGMDPEALRRTISDRTRVVIATHLYGVPCRIDEIARIAEEHDAVLIEDCAHCLGASVNGRKAGAYGRFGYFSFETSKPVNTLGGGMVTTRRAEDAKRIREVAAKEPGKDFSWLLKRLGKTTFEATVTNPLVFNLGVYPALRLLTGKDKEDDRFASGYQKDEVSLAGRLGRYTNYQAELGLSQLPLVVKQIERRASHARRLMDRVGDRVHFQRNDRPGVESNYMLVTAILPRMSEVARELLQRGVDTKYRYMRDCSGLLNADGEFPMAARAEREVLHIPAYPELSDAQIDSIADRVIEAVEAVDAVSEPAASAG